MIGTEFAVSAFINPVLWRFERGAQIKAIHMFAAQLGFVMPFWYGMGLVLLLAETFCDAASAGARTARDGKRNLGTGDRADSDVVGPHQQQICPGRDAANDRNGGARSPEMGQDAPPAVAALTAAMVMFLLSVK